MRNLHYIFLLFLTISLFSCKKEEPVLGNITGIVLSDGIPVSSALVKLLSNSEVIQTTSTSGSGLFVFSNVPLGNYQIMVTKEGFVDFEKSVNVSSAIIQEVEVTFIAENGNISGNVTDDNGLSVAGVSVSLKMGSTEIGNTQTNASGEFSFNDIETGNYELSFTKDGFDPTTSSTVVNPNQTSQLSVTMVKTLGDLNVVVKDNFGGAIFNAFIEILSGSDVIDSRSLGSSENTTLFEDLPTGDYSVRITRNGFIEGLDDVTVVKDIATDIELRLSPESLPSGGVMDSRVTSSTSSSASFVLDIFILDSNGNFVTGLTQNDFVLSDATFGSFTFDFTPENFSESNINSSDSYSAAMLIDQSGSISGTDPNHSRIQASKLFMSVLGPGDNAALAAFSSGFDSKLPQNLTIYENSIFSSDGSIFYDELDDLKSKVGGGTPLFKSTLDMVTFTAGNSSNFKKAVIVFTDGEDTSGGATIDQVVSAATTSNVKVFTVGLGTGTDVLVLGEMATRTNGSFMNALDARELVTLFGTLGKILGGTASFYSVGWTVSANGSAFPAKFSSSIAVNTPNGNISIPLFVNVTSTTGRLINSDSPVYYNYPHKTSQDY